MCRANLLNCMLNMLNEQRTPGQLMSNAKTTDDTQHSRKTKCVNRHRFTIWFMKAQHMFMFSFRHPRDITVFLQFFRSKQQNKAVGPPGRCNSVDPCHISEHFLAGLTVSYSTGENPEIAHLGGPRQTVRPSHSCLDDAILWTPVAFLSISYLA